MPTEEHPLAKLARPRTAAAAKDVVNYLLEGINFCGPLRLMVPDAPGKGETSYIQGFHHSKARRLVEVAVYALIGLPYTPQELTCDRFENYSDVVRNLLNFVKDCADASCDEDCPTHGGGHDAAMCRACQAAALLRVFHGTDKPETDKEDRLKAAAPELFRHLKTICKAIWNGELEQNGAEYYTDEAQALLKEIEGK